MITSPDLLRKETVASLSNINSMIKDLEDRAERIGTSPYRMRDSNGALELAPLLLAKIMAVNTLVHLNPDPRSRRV
jgi:hypothetical protein